MSGNSSENFQEHLERQQISERTTPKTRIQAGENISGASNVTGETHGFVGQLADAYARMQHRQDTPLSQKSYSTEVGNYIFLDENSEMVSLSRKQWERAKREKFQENFEASSNLASEIEDIQR